MSCGCGSECGCESIQLPTIDGQDGQSAYEIAVSNGFVGTEQQWLASLNGDDGDSAYSIAVANGFVGTEQDWLDSLVGPSGTNGSNGDDGINAFTYTNTAYTQPANTGFGSVVVSMDEIGWAMLGQPVFIQGGGHYRVLGKIPATPGYTGSGSLNLLRLPVGSFPVTGTVIASGSGVSPSGEPGATGNTGSAGTNGTNGTTGTVDTTAIVPTLAPTPGAETVIYYNSGNNDHILYWWDGSAWINRGNLNGSRGAYTYQVTGNPNTVPPPGAADGDWAIRTDVANQITYWNRAGGAWSLITTVTGASTSALNDVFRVGKLVNQPVPMGSTAAVILQFEDWTTSGRYNYGPWDGSKATVPAGAAANQTFIIENFRIDRISGAGEIIDFTLDILLNGVSVATDTVSLTALDNTGNIVVLTTGSIAVSASDEINVTVTPSVGSTAQWSVNYQAIVFYNQTA